VIGRNYFSLRHLWYVEMRHVPFNYTLLLDLQWRKATENLCQYNKILLSINCCADLVTTWADWLIELFTPSVKTMYDIRQSLVGTFGLQVVKLRGYFRSELSFSFCCGWQRMEPSNLCEFACYKKVKLHYLQSKTIGIAVLVCSIYSYQQQNSRQGTCNPLQGRKVAHQAAYSLFCVSDSCSQHSDETMVWIPKELCSDSQQWQEIFLPSIQTSSGPTQPHIQWVLGALSSQIKLTGARLTTCPT
jgi:hypothetical protein